MHFEHFSTCGIAFSGSPSGSQDLQYFISFSLLVWVERKYRKGVIFLSCFECFVRKEH